jgi:hypothetical protein
MARDPLSTNYEAYAARVQERLYGEYRARLDEERRLKQSRRDVIDVRAQNVDVEKAASRAASAARGAQQETAVQQALAGHTDDVRLAQANRRRTVANPDTELANPPFMYEPQTDSLEIALKTSPLPRGMFVDLMV